MSEDGLFEGGAPMIVVVGGGAVGKSAVTVRFVSREFVDEYDPTIEDCFRKTYEVDEEVCTFDIVDTAGQEEYVHISSVYMGIASGFIFVFALDERETVNEVKLIYKRIEDQRDMNDVPLILVGNKSDLIEERDISEDLGKELAKQWNCNYIETSAKTGENVDEVFMSLSRDILNYTSKETTKTNSSKGKRLCILL